MGHYLELLPNKGLNTAVPAEFIAHGTVPEVVNMQVVKGLVSKRYGSRLFGSNIISGTNKEVMAIMELDREGVRNIIRVGRQKVEIYNKLNQEWIECLDCPDLTGTINDIINSAIAFDADGLPLIVFTNGKDNIRTFNGNIVSVLEGISDKPKYVSVIGSYMLIANIDNGIKRFGNMVQWCDTGNITEWTNGNAGGQMLIDDNNDEEITGMRSFGKYIAIHKDNGIYLAQLVESSAVFYFEKIITGVGACCNNSIQNLNTGEQIFLSKDGIRIFNGTSASLIVSPMQDDIRSYLNPKLYHRCWSILVPERDEYWLGVPLGSDSSPHTVYKYNYITGAMYKDLRPGVNCVGKFTKDNSIMIDNVQESVDSQNYVFDNIEILALHKQIVFGFVDGKTTIVDSTTNDDCGNVVNTIYESRDYYIENYKFARWTKLLVWAKGNSLTMSCSIDKGLTWSKGLTIKLDTEFPKASEPKIFYFDWVSDTIRFRFSNDKAGEKWSLKQYKLECVGREAIK